MKASLLFYLSVAVVIPLVHGVAAAAEPLSIDRYTCREFLADIAQTTDGGRLLRASVFIAWSTGYASAFQKDSVRADAKAFKLIGAAIGDTCKNDPGAVAITAIVGKINSLVRNK